MTFTHRHGTAHQRNSRTAKLATFAVVALGLATACSPPDDGGSASADVASSAPSSPLASSASPSTDPSQAVTPPPPNPDPAPVGWPRPGWTAQTLGFTGVSGVSGISVSVPDTWYFDDNEVGLWTDGTAKIFCDAWRDPELLNPGAPTITDLANSRWNATFGAGAAANPYGFQTFYGAHVWGADVTLGDGTTVEPRAFVTDGDVWIECGAIIRGTSSTAPELHDIIDSIQILDPGAMEIKSWTESP